MSNKIIAQRSIQSLTVHIPRECLYLQHVFIKLIRRPTTVKTDPHFIHLDLRDDVSDYPYIDELLLETIRTSRNILTNSTNESK